MHLPRRIADLRSGWTSSGLQIPTMGSSPLLWGLLGTSAVSLSLLIILFDGNPVVAGGALVIVSIVALTVYRLDWGFYIFLAISLLFDNLPVTGFTSLTSTVGYYYNLSSIPYLPRNSLIVTPMELHLGLLVITWLTQRVLKFRSAGLPFSPRFSPLLILAVIVLGLIVGQMKRGDFVIALWEIRGMAYLVILLFLIPQIIRTTPQIRTVMWIALSAILVKAVQGALRWASLGFTFGRWPEIYQTLTNHEDPVFVNTLFLMLAGFVVFRLKDRQRTALWLATPLLFIGYMSGNRRAAYAALMVLGAAFFTLLSRESRVAILKKVLVPALLLSVYLALFWNSNSRLAFLALQVKSTVTQEPGIRGEFDVGSAFYREMENFNLAVTFRESPLVGVGFGRPFQMVLRLWGVNERLGAFIPHNQILWIFVKVGAVGGLLFWLFFGFFVFSGARRFSAASDPYLKVIILVGVTAVLNQLVVSFVDLQLTYGRNMIYLATLMANASTAGWLALETGGEAADHRLREVRSPSGRKR